MVSPSKVAVIGCPPRARVLVVKVAWLVPSKVAVPNGLPPSLNVTDPEAPVVSVAVNVTEAP